MLYVSLYIILSGCNIDSTLNETLVSIERIGIYILFIGKIKRN